jgi:hypothetical protein
MALTPRYIESNIRFKWFHAYTKSSYSQITVLNWFIIKRPVDLSPLKPWYTVF